MLKGLRILDFSTLLPGPFATMYLADLGAEVVKVEAPGRWDMVRSRPPFDDGVAAGHSLLNRNKRSLALDLKKPGAAEVVFRLIESYDIVVEQFRPGVMDRLGIGYDALAERKPDIIYCSLTGYGQTGPMRDRAGHDNNYLALAGVMSHSGTHDHGPVPLGVQIADIGAGSFGVVIGILSAVVHRNATGQGQFVDVSMYDGSLLWNAYASAAYFVGEECPDYESMPLNGGTHYGYYRTSDNRYLSVGSLEPKFWAGFCEAIGRPEWGAERVVPGDRAEAIKLEIRDIVATKTLAEWREIFGDRNVCVEPVLTLDEAFKHPQAVARDMIAEVPKPNGGVQRQVAAPLKFSGYQPEYRNTGSVLGEHTESVLREAGYSDQEIDELRESGVFGSDAD